MTVKELIEELKNYDPDSRVVVLRVGNRNHHYEDLYVQDGEASHAPDIEAPSVEIVI